jgi:transcription antitermination factor NusG
VDSPESPSGRNRWFCIAATYGQHFQAELALAADRWPVYHPLHLDRRSSRIEPLFHGYLFVQFDLDGEDWPRICRTRGVYRILGDPGHPLPLPEGVIEDLQARTSPRRVVDDPGSAPFPAQMPPGTPVRLVGGVWDDLRGITAASRQNRLAVLLSLFNRDVVVTVRPDAVARVA